MKKNITITDIASAVGVSKTTVSRYLNGHTELMSKDTAESIKKVIELLDYHPSQSARALKSGKSNMIGVVIADISSPFSSAIILGIEDYLNQYGYMPMFVNCANDPKKEIELVKQLHNRGVDGLIVNTTSMKSTYLIEYALSGLPIVLCDRKINNYTFNIVSLDNTQLFSMLISHLKEEGFTRVALFNEPWNENSSRRERRQTFISCMQDIYGYDASDDMYEINQENHPKVMENLRNLADDTSNKCAIIGANTITTIRIYQFLHRLGLKIPDNIGLCGPDDWDWDENINLTRLLHPHITTAIIPSREMGRQCAKMLLDTLTHPSDEALHYNVPLTLATNHSTKLSSGT